MPAFEHDGLELYATDAITRYVNDAFAGIDLVPTDPVGRARMAQAIDVINSYGYPAIIGQIFVQRAVMPITGATADEDAIAAAIPRPRRRSRRSRSCSATIPILPATS